MPLTSDTVTHIDNIRSLTKTRIQSDVATAPSPHPPGNRPKCPGTGTARESLRRLLQLHVPEAARNTVRGSHANLYRQFYLGPTTPRRKMLQTLCLARRAACPAGNRPTTNSSSSSTEHINKGFRFTRDGNAIGQGRRPIATVADDEKKSSPFFSASPLRHTLALRSGHNYNPEQIYPVNGVAARCHQSRLQDLQIFETREYFFVAIPSAQVFKSTPPLPSFYFRQIFVMTWDAFLHSPPYLLATVLVDHMRQSPTTSTQSALMPFSKGKLALERARGKPLSISL